MAERAKGNEPEFTRSIEGLVKLGTISDLRVSGPGGPVEFKVTITHDHLDAGGESLRTTLATITREMM
jgi:hypothetical protein